MSKEMSKKTKFIFVTGGVVSSLGKGIVAASLGVLLKAQGYSVTIQKFDPYQQQSGLYIFQYLKPKMIHHVAEQIGH